MTEGGLTASSEFLTDAAVKYFEKLYENPQIAIASEIDPDLGWVPSLHFKANDHLTIAAEVSETPYPAILRLRHADILNVQTPIAVYCVCPEEVFLQEHTQREVKALESHGYGLLTVDRNGDATRRTTCIPLIQHLPDPEFTLEIRDFPKQLRLRMKDAFAAYKNNPGSGVKELSEILEALVINAGKKAAAKGWINKATVSGPLAGILDEITTSKQCKTAVAAVGGARSYVSEYRNTSHHIPKNKKQAYIKYRDCLHGFRDGIRKIRNFKEAMKKIGINVNV